MLKLKILTILSASNIFIFGYILWEKLNSNRCPSCNNVPFLPISDIQLALAGTIGAITLLIIIYFSTKTLVLKYLAFVLSFFFTVFGFFLLGGQLTFHMDLCYYCITTTMIFYIVFGLLLYDIIIKNIRSILKIK